MKQSRQNKNYKLSKARKISYWKKFEEWLLQKGIERYTTGRHLSGYRWVDGGGCATVSMIMLSVEFDEMNKELWNKAYSQ